MTKGKLKIHRDVLERLWAKGESVARIAAVFDVTGPAVTAAARRWGLPDRTTPEEERRAARSDIVRRLWAEGVSQRQIAKAVGVHERMVRKIADQMGLPPRGTAALPPFDMARARSLRVEGWTFGAIGAEFGRSASWISGQFRADLDIGARAAAAQKSGIARLVARRSTDPHPYWTVERDALVIATAGRYRDLTALAAVLGQTATYVNQRWLRLRVAG